MTFVVLDVTRTLTATNIVTPTGVDRVERAYIAYYEKSESDVIFLYRDMVIDRRGMAELMARVRGQKPWGARDLRAMGRGFAGQVASDIRRFSGAALPDEFTYLNVSHTNLEVIELLEASRVVVLVHDMIPLDTPEYQTPATLPKFEAQMRLVADKADLIIANSRDTRDRVSHWFGKWGASPPIVVNLLGIEPVAEVTPVQSERPYFLILGTIEPRKNHRLLLDVWENLQDLPPSKRPILQIIGRRGWLNEDVFHRLDSSPMMGVDVIEHGTLTDREVAAYLRGAQALLFPAFSEGFGLPLIEAISVGTPTIVSDIPVFRELAGPLSLYLNSSDGNDWRKAIIEQIKQGQAGNTPANELPFKLPNWDDHFEQLERDLRD